MNAQVCSNVWRLAPGQLVQLDHARGTRLQVTRGKLWVTLENDTRDIVLGPGASFTIDRGGLTLAEAQGTTRVCVDVRDVEHHIGDVLAGVRSRITARLSRAIESGWRKRRFVPYY